ncbi:hypothetical protein [Dulcicalothrix desertica]|nr:hypothetical protein [Dulcicalothrix desertica]
MMPTPQENFEYFITWKSLITNLTNKDVVAPEPEVKIMFYWGI